MVGLQDAQAADPQVQNDFTRPVYWTKLRLVYERALPKDVDSWRWFELVPEPGNPHDCDAVAVELDGVRVGYIAADLAYGLHGNIRYLNGDGRACYVPGVALGGESVYVALPTWATLERLVDRDLIATELAALWQALPRSARDQYAATRFQETRETAKQVVALRHVAPHAGLPVEPDPDRMPRVWDAFLRERKAEHARDVVAERNVRVLALQAEGRTRAEIARSLGISTSTVSKVLSTQGGRTDGSSLAAEGKGTQLRPPQPPSEKLRSVARSEGVKQATTTRTALSMEGIRYMAQPNPTGPIPSKRPGLVQHEPVDQGAYDDQTREVAAALEVWKRGLLTVSGASRLINYRATKLRSVTIDTPDANVIVTRLDAGHEWVFEGTKDEEATGEGAGLRADGSRTDPQLASTPPTLMCARPHKELGPALRTIMRQANTEWLDRGLHVLYLALGMLHWQDVDESEYTSPLILVPVELVPLGPKDIPHLKAAEDEPVLNPALRVQLQRLGVELPGAEQMEGLDIDLQLVMVQEAVAAKKGWQVTSDVVLSMFSFHKEAMYKDLVENAETIVNHPIVRVLGTSDPLKQSRLLDFEPISPEDIDRLAPPETTPVVLDADSSQRSAIAAAVAGRSFVMDGPPGTGKSQTIANMVGALLHAGKSVLFVSEKAAALEVVRNRLEQVGLLPYLFELHSSKTSRKEVATELLRALETKPVPPAGMSEQNRGLAALRRESLSAYANAMNETRLPLDKSLHEILGRISQLTEAPQAPIPSTGVEKITSDQYWRFKELTKTLHLCWRPAEQGASYLWKDVVDQAPLEERFFAARRRLEELQGAIDNNRELAEAFSLKSPSQVERLAALVELQTEERPDGVLDAWLMSRSLDEMDAAFGALQADLDGFHQADKRWLRAAEVEWDDFSGFSIALAGAQKRTGTSFATAPLTAAGCDAASRELQDLTDALSRALSGGRLLSTALGLPDLVTTADLDRVLALVALCAAPHQPSRDWFSVQGSPLAHHAVQALEASVSRLEHLEAEAKPYFTDAALHAPVEDLLTRFRTEHKGLKKLSSAYRADKKQVSELLASDVGVSDGIKGLEKAVAWAKAHFEYEAEAHNEGPALGAYWNGRATRFEDTKQALDVVDRAFEVLAGLPLNEQLLAYLTSESGRSLAGSASEVQRNLDLWRRGLHPGGALHAHQTIALEPLLDVLTWMEAQSRVAAEDAARVRVVDAALGRLHTTLEADRMLALWSERGTAAGALDAGDRYRRELGTLFQGTRTDTGSLRTALDWARQVRELVGGELSEAQVGALLTTRTNPRLRPAKERWDSAAEAILSAFAGGRRHDLQLELDDFDGAIELIAELEADPAGQAEWFRYTTLRRELAELGLEETTRACNEERMPSQLVPGALEKALLRGWANSVIAADPRLVPPSTAERRALVEQYRSLDTELIHTAHSRIIRQVNAQRPQFLGMGEQGVIQREGMKKKRHIPVRDLIARTKSTALSLKPCFMMSPLAVSQYLPSDIRFDVVIFDEASQVLPSDAVNCVYRGHAMILAGDDKQLPPTSFFEKMDEGDLEQEETDVKDFESVLELAKASGALRNIPLRWHYRSADDALINYSNYKFYEGKLVVFPGPGSKKGDPAVSFHKVNGVYRRGATADNPREAAAVAARVIEHFSKTPDQTLGVVTFSVAQASAVQDAIDRAREGRRDLDKYFDVSERLHAFFVKSLESVQGDERDKIIFSVGYGPDENGKITTNFGVLNRDKGWRRLNVAVTRARKCVELVASMRAGDIPPSPNENVEYLRAYLDYAERGMPALAVNLGTTGASPDSPFEESVLAVLTGWGYTVEPQVGSAGYRIDIGVRHPAHPGLFLLGIECDGYQYHSAPAARDRDRLREQVLRRLGWRLHRIWGTSWYRDRGTEEARLRKALEDAIAGNGHTSDAKRRAAVELGFETVEQMERPDWARTYVEASVPRLPRWIDVSEPGAGHDMAAGVLSVIDLEGPVHVEVLDQRLRDAWGIGRIGAKIRANIDSAIRHAGAKREGQFLTLPGGSSIHVRTPSDRTIRKAEQIHHEELAAAMLLLLSEMGSATGDQLIVSAARLFGWNRTGSNIQDRLEPVIEALVETELVTRANGLLSHTEDRS